MLVDYSHQAYILSCNDTDYSFFGSLNYQQTGVHVEGIAGHNICKVSGLCTRQNGHRGCKVFGNTYRLGALPVALARDCSARASNHSCFK